MRDTSNTPKHGAFGMLFAACLVLAFASNEALPALGFASISAATTLALACVGVLTMVLWRPVFSVSMLYFMVISLTVFLAGVGIEAGGYLTETGVQGEATGAFSRLLWYYVIFTLCALMAFQRVLPQRPRERPVVPRMTVERGSLMLGLALAAAVLAAGVLAGVTEGFALLKGVNRFALRNDSAGAGPIFNLFLNNQLFVAVLLGTLCTARERWVRLLAMLMALADIGLEVLHGEQFMSVLGLSLSMLTPFIAVHAMNGKPVVRYLGIGAGLALLLGSVSVMYAYKGQGLDMSDTVMSRMLLQGQVWYVVDGDASLLNAPQGGGEAFGRVVDSLASSHAPTFFDEGEVSGLRDLMIAYAKSDILRYYMHDDVTFTMGQMAVPVYWFGFAGAALFIAFTGLVYGALAALQIVVAMRGGIVLLWLTTKIVSYASFGLQQGEYWNIFGIRTLSYAVIAGAWWYCFHSRSAQQTSTSMTSIASITSGTRAVPQQRKWG